jgi:selenocysteine-specific elongation factor
MTVVVGTAGHIDHGKTALLQALTGIDADRLPEERRRGMTIDVGYAYFGLADGSELDFVDVPGHDRLVGNMLVGAGEIDAVMLVVAADDGPRAQTYEHVELLDALGVRHGIAVITKSDVVEAARVAEVRDAVSRLLAGTWLVASPVLAASSVSGQGIDAVRHALETLRDRVEADRVRWSAPGQPSSSRLAIDRIFSVRGRGLVVTGTLRGGPISRNASLRLVPGEAQVRARGLQVHGRTVEMADAGRTAINLAGIEAGVVHRGAVLTDDPAVVATDRILARISWALPDRARVRVHLGTAATEGAIGRSGRDAIDLDAGTAAAVVRLSEPMAARPGDRFVLRLGSGPDHAVGGVVLDVAPPRGISRRRQTRDRVANLAAAIAAQDDHAIDLAHLDLHGARPGIGSIALAHDVAEAAAADVESALAATIESTASRPTLAEVRARCARTIRQSVTLRRDEAAAAAERLIARLIDRGRLVRDGEHVGLPGSGSHRSAGMDPAVAAAMDRLARALAVASPPPLQDAARVTACPETGVRELIRTGRIVLLDRDLAYEAGTYRGFERLALDMADRAPLTPAVLRDATATSRKYVMAILADLDRRGVLRRIDAGHVPGPRAAMVAGEDVVAAGDARTGDR